MISDCNIYKLPRLYVAQELSDQILIELKPEQAHYLCNVMRLKEGAHVRIFDGQSGEWLAKLTDIGKKQAKIGICEQIQGQPFRERRIHLLFCPLKKNRMDWLIEKAVELGATDLHPIVTQNSEVRKINESRLHQQIIEAAEQCERLDLPLLHSLEKLELMLSTWSAEIPILACVERYEASRIETQALKSKEIAILVGPEGGFTEEEKEYLTQKTIPVSLGECILRSETAAIKSLSLIS